MLYRTRDLGHVLTVGVSFLNKLIKEQERESRKMNISKY
jgi:hypothetical protein